MKILVFDIWADYGHFRVPYTTSSPLTLSVPSKTVLYGIISAILGYDKDSYLEHFQDNQWRFAVGIKKPIKTVYIPENFIDTKSAKMFGRMPKNKPRRTQINLEFLKEPYFRIYATSENDKLVRLKNLLENHKSTYTVSLGLSECLANFKYIGLFGLEKRQANDKPVEIVSIIPLNKLTEPSQVDFLSENSKFLKIHIPLEMKPDRELIKSGYFLIEANGNPIKLKSGEYYHVKELDENIFLF
ncbi:type I-B CRISPR-associated protein Cas5b [Hippea alviniae]|uniref:type I-B CRISPR-associated protein Cas5b n=1 Tax=Hippea alviniae TaxID=1279027 RepID=UPI0003B51B90|nr:type I-B CRISPR-associated protein Cas5b [Hippea alviniae]